MLCHIYMIINTATHTATVGWRNRVARKLVTSPFPGDALGGLTSGLVSEGDQQHQQAGGQAPRYEVMTLGLLLLLLALHPDLIIY